MFGRDFVVDIDAGVECSCEGSIFVEGNLEFLGAFADTEGEFVDSFCDHDGSVHGVLLVGEGDGIVCGIGDDDVSFWHGLHHALSCAFVTNLAKFCFDVWVAFGIFEFVFDFLFGHSEFFYIVHALVDEVEHGENEEYSKRRCEEVEGEV